MELAEILETLNEYYVNLEKIAQSPEWLKIVSCQDIDPEAKTHLGDLLHYLGEAMGVVEEVMENGKQ